MSGRKFKVGIDIMLLPELLDPQGVVVHKALQQLGFQGIEKVRVGKHIDIDIEASDREEAIQIAEEMCSKLLANPVVETYRIHVEEL
ncbi:MAG: phosphoribosylformylglycinamidine synthase subunit PurS [Chlorobi bacterium]|nr:phosphoribosylformylglycinamidine synthase subunit PurS [Chlorobiota bacterium]